MAAITPMSRSGTDTDDGVKQRSGWLIPIAVFVVTAGLSALFLLYYLAPTPNSLIEEHPVPTARSDAVSTSVGKLVLKVPANYILYRSARTGGARKALELYATFPDFHGYTDADAQTFAGNSSDSPVVYMLIREDQINITEEQKLQRIYLNYVADPAGKPGPFGLTQYAFRDDSGYRGEDLFVAQGEKGLVVMRCVRFSQDVQSPSCLRDMRLVHGISLTYRFKRANLAHWQEISSGVETLLNSFSARAK